MTVSGQEKFVQEQSMGPKALHHEKNEVPSPNGSIERE
jgi:hypothetical protein